MEEPLVIVVVCSVFRPTEGCDDKWRVEDTNCRRFRNLDNVHEIER